MGELNDRQGPRSSSQPEFGSDLAAQVVRNLGIKFIALAPGASFRGFQDSVVNFGPPENPEGDPEVIECLHEAISVGIAHGYAKASGMMMAAAIHNVVGLQNASMAIFNAWSDSQPVLIIGGTGPTDIEHRRPGVDWRHTALVQGNLVRDFVKWDDQPTSHFGVIEGLLRANRLALEEPRGPVYVCLDAGLQEVRLDTNAPQVPARPTWALPGVPPAADHAAIEGLANAVRSAKWPVIIAGRSGRSDAGFRLLAELADTHAIPVVEHGNLLNLPSNHSMNLTGGGRDVFANADLVISLDVKDLNRPLEEVERDTRTTRSLLPTGATVYSIGLDDYAARGWSSDYQSLYPVTVSLLADTTSALAQLRDALGEPASTTAVRHAEITAWHERLRAASEQRASDEQDLSPIAWSVLARTLRDALRSHEFVIAHGDLLGWVRRLFDMDQPRQFLGGSGGGGLGYGPAATVGACLAHRDSDTVVVDLQPDGDFMMGPQALWTLAHHRLPALIVLCNNRSFYNSEEHQLHHAKLRSRDSSRAGVGTRIDEPNIDFVRLAESQGIVGIGPIADPAVLADELVRACNIVVNDRRPVLVDVVTQPR